MTFIETAVDGVPAVWAEGGERLTAGLTFRVGMADETLATSGTTHLTEHLALERLTLDGTEHMNGMTSALTTTFVVSGSEEKVAEFFGSVCASLRDLPVARLGEEKRVLRSEQAGRPLSAVGALHRRRYGATGHGLPGFGELGVAAATGEAVTAWSARYFTKGNAALWASGGTKPPALALDLPAGARMPPPEATVVLETSPAYFHANAAGPAFSGVVRRSMAAQAYTWLLRTRLTAEIRHKQALSYAPLADYSVRDSSFAHVVSGADGLPESMPILVAEFSRLLSRLADNEPGADELRDVIKRMIAANAGRAPDRWLQRSALNILLGRPVRTLEDVHKELSGLSPADVRVAAQEAFGTGLFLVPRQEELFQGTITRVPVSVPMAPVSPVAARKAPSRNAPFDDSRLIIGSDAAGIADGTGVRGIRYSDCAALQSWPDGARRLIAADGSELRIEPTLWRLPKGAITRLDSMLPAARHIRMPSRQDDEIPRPGATIGLRLAGRLLRQPVLTMLATIVILVAVPAGISRISPHVAEGVVVVMAFALFAIISWVRNGRDRLWRAALNRIAARGTNSGRGALGVRLNRRR